GRDARLRPDRTRQPRPVPRGGTRGHPAAARPAERADARGRVRARGGGGVAVPIHDQGYRRFLGRRDGRGNSWLVIASTAVRTVLKKRMFLGILLVAWAPFILRA